MVCGKVAQETYSRLATKPNIRTVYLPHPAARNWTREAIRLTTNYIQQWETSLELTLTRTGLQARKLI